MRSIGFLLSRRWILLGVTVALLAWLAWLLGQWQFARLDDRLERNERVQANTAAAPADVAAVMAVGEPLPPESEWRRITATGTYAADETVVVRYRTRDGRAGVNLVVPLVTVEGPRLLVDRGWMATDNRGVPGDIPRVAAEPVTIVGWVRVDAEGPSTAVNDLSTRAISSATIGPAIGAEVYGGFVELESESVDLGAPLSPARLPDLDSGPHFFYGLQWWFFGALALFGFGYLAWDEWRRARPGGPGPRSLANARGARTRRTDQRDLSNPPSTGSITPVRNDAAGDIRKPATEPNSAGSP
ncbi:SURF1 family cytochrome oxidase biogenesis protein [Nocardioides limicola]|uniref:SURF1 family cytochrome oxidase biogenesis protein n=1 Tax=Nocardioides limicola TaxID=2803368 RepID=UPI00193BB52D|nr:SURF1 family protein [Nocardioides sp. DJM-14]